MIHWYFWNDGFKWSLYCTHQCWYCSTSMWIQFRFTMRMWIVGCTGLHATALNAALLEHFNLSKALHIMYIAYFRVIIHFTNQRSIAWLLTKLWARICKGHIGIGIVTLRHLSPTSPCSHHSIRWYPTKKITLHQVKVWKAKQHTYTHTQWTASSK